MMTEKKQAPVAAAAAVAEVPSLPVSPDDSGVDFKTSSSPSPLAFTINFDGDLSNSKVKSRPFKKLGLRDGIKIFAPKLRSSTPTSVPQERPPPPQPPAEEVVLNQEEENKAAAATTTVEKDATAAVAAAEGGSDTGTYTIDNDDVGEVAEDEARKKINSVFGVESSQKCDDWISRWAEDQAKIIESPPLSDGSTRRRKLPPLPQCDKRETDDLLKGTISAMNAIEARIDDSKTKAKSSSVNRITKKTTTTTTTTTAHNFTNNSNKLSGGIDVELEAWKRRKNYRPIKPFKKSDNRNNSDIESEASERSVRNSSLRGQKLKLKSATGTAKTQLKKSLSGSPRNDPCSSTNGVRSTSSMSSKDAEFQAWKRRKNYNPLAAVATANQRKKQQQLQKQQQRKLQEEDDDEEERLLKSLQVNSSPLSMPPRSASFHYPDGMSRIQHNVYTSEDEDSLDDEDILIATIYHNPSTKKKSYQSFLDNHECNSDTDGGGGGGRGAISSPIRHHQKDVPSKLEALDNLVITTIFSVSTKLCLNSQLLLQRARSRTDDVGMSSLIDTLLYVLDDTDLPPMSSSKKTSRELSGTLRNLKKVEQVLQVMDKLYSDDDDESDED